MSGTRQTVAFARRGRFSWAGVAGTPSRGGHAAVRILLAVILLVAALLKGYQLATGPLLGDGLLASRPVLIAVVEFEWVLGLCMLFGLYPKRTWQVALACFSVFTCVSFYKGLAGDASCGCFGRLEVSPWYTFALDAAAVLALFLCPPRDRAPGDEPDLGDPKRLLGFSRVGVVLAVAIFVGIPGALAMATYHPATLGGDGGIVGPGNVVVIEPEKWVGKKFPLLPFIEDVPGDSRPGVRPLRKRLAEGSWIIVLYHQDCSQCQAAIHQYEALARRLATDPTAPRVAMIEVPPYGNANAFNLSPTAPSVLGRLGGERHWFVNTPMTFELHNGMFERVAENRYNIFVSISPYST